MGYWWGYGLSEWLWVIDMYMSYWTGYVCVNMGMGYVYVNGVMSYG